MMKRPYQISIIFTALLLSHLACRISGTGIGSKNLAAIYDNARQIYQFQHKSHFINDTTLRIFFKLNTSELLFQRETPEGELKAEVKLHFSISNSYDSRIQPDTLAIFFTLKQSQKGSDYSGYQDLTAERGKNYLLFFTITDLNRQRSEIALTEITGTTFVQSDFLATDSNGDVLFNDRIEEGFPFQLQTNASKNLKLKVGFFKKQFSPALPPFAQSRDRGFELTPDSVFYVQLSNGHSKELVFNNPGFYTISDTLQPSHPYVLLVTEPGFPGVMLVKQMLGPMRYLTTKPEFERLASQTNIKKAIDDFWITNSGSPDRAREMIRRYFTRVQEANTMFTSIYEGWKTDRGMTYIIYGPPGIIYRNEKGESWIYGEPGNLYSLTLNFSKVKNNFTDKEYQLIRSSNYKESWYDAVDIWRR